MHTEGASPGLAQELQQFLSPVSINCLVGSGKLQNFSVTLGERNVDVIDGKLLELPRATTAMDRSDVIEAIPSVVQFRRKFFFVFLSLFLDVGLERINNLLRGGVVSGQGVDQSLDAGFCRGTKNDVGLCGNVLLLPIQCFLRFGNDDRAADVNENRHVETVNRNRALRAASNVLEIKWLRYFLTLLRA